MKIISSYGVELRKQNIPIRQTLEIYRSAVICYLVEVKELWDLNLYNGKNWSKKIQKTRK